VDRINYTDPVSNDHPAMMWRRFLPVALVLLGATAVHLPALVGGQYFLDIYLTEVHPSWAAIERSLADGELPFWTSDILLGYPLASNPQVGALYPVNWLIVSIFGATRGIVFSVWLHSVWGALGLFVLARRGGLSATSAALASLIVVCSPFFLFYHQAIHGLIALAWFPWILWCGWVVSETGSWRMWVVGALFLALQMYAGHLQFVAYTVIALFVLIGWAPKYASRRKRIYALWMMGLQQVVALLLYGPQLLLAYVLWRNSLRSGLQADDMTNNLAIETLGLDDLVEIVSPQFWGGPTHTDFWYPEFLGIAVILLMLASMILPAREPLPRIVRLARILWIGGLSYLALMCVPGVNYLFASVPGLSAFRAPGRLFYWLLFSGALMAGHGAVSLQTLWSDGAARMRQRRLVLLSFLVLSAVFGVLLVVGILPGGADEMIGAMRRADGLHLVVTSALVFFGLLIIRIRSDWARHLPVYLALVTVVSVSWVGFRYIPTLPNQAVSNPPLAPVLRHPESPVRRIVGLSASDVHYESTVPGLGWPHSRQGSPEKAAWGLHANVGMAHGLQNLHGQTSLPLRRFVRRIFGDDVRPLDYPFHQSPPLDAHLLSHLGVTHVVTSSGRQTSELPIQPLGEPTREDSGYLVYALENPREPARFYPLSAVRGVNGESDAMATIQRRGKTPDVPLIVEGIRGNGTHGTPMAVSIVEENAGKATLTYDAAEDGVVLYTESWFPGWTARVNDADVDVLVADGMFMGVPVSAGVNRIELVYQPVGFPLGLVLLALGLLACLIALTKGRKNASPGTVQAAGAASPAS